MLRRIALASFLIGLTLGCGKKPTFTGSSSEPAQPAASRDKEKPNDRMAKSGKGDKAAPNWLNDPRFQKGKDGSTNGADGDLPGKPGWGLNRPDGGWTGGNPPTAGSPAAAGGPTSPGGPGAGPARPAVPGGAGPTGGAPAGGARPITENDMKDIALYIDTRSAASGQMPGPREVMEALFVAKSPAAELVRGGYIVVTGARTRESIWAYEKNAPFGGGWVAGIQGAERMTAADLNARLAGR